MKSKNRTCGYAITDHTLGGVARKQEGPMMRMCSLAASAVAAGILWNTAQAAEIKVIAATPMAPVIQELGAQFEQTSGHKLVTKFVSGPIVKQQIDSGETFDLAVSITPVVDTLIREGKLVAATRADLAYGLIGLGVRAGVPKPDISTVDQFKRALLNAKSVAHSATGASGEHFKKMIERLGISEEMKPKLRPMSADRIPQAVPNGEAEMIVVTMSVIMVPGAEVVGPVPAELQFYNRFAGAVGTNAKHAQAAAALLGFLAAPAAAVVIKAKGLQPGTPR
jgi:molybdate transport system substrate-binding protein